MNLGADHDHPRHPETAVSRWWPEYHCSYPLVFYPLELVKKQLEVCPRVVEDLPLVSVSPTKLYFGGRCISHLSHLINASTCDSPREASLAPISAY